MPTRKMTAAGGGGLPVGILVVWLLQSAGVDIPAEVGAAIGTVVSFVLGWLMRERDAA